MRLDRAIRRQFPSFKQGQLEKLLRQGKIRLDAQKAKAGMRVHLGQKIQFHFDVSSYLSQHDLQRKKLVAPQISDSVKKDCPFPCGGAPIAKGSWFDVLESPLLLASRDARRAPLGLGS